jgi:GPH family glycoside/pentoside/hexuronide:cation symporter
MSSPSQPDKHPEQPLLNTAETDLPQPAPAKDHSEQDASRGQIMLYAFGNIENAIAGRFFDVLQTVMVVAMHVNPLLIGLMLGLKSLWDAVTDPIMAYVTDNTKSRWGRRIPYILVGGVSRIAILALIIAFFPRSSTLTSNLVLEGQKQADESVKAAQTAARLHLDLFTRAASGTAVAEGDWNALAKAMKESAKAPVHEQKFRAALEAQAAERAKIADDLQAVLDQTGAAMDAGERTRNEIRVGLERKSAQGARDKAALLTLAAQRHQLNLELDTLARGLREGTLSADAALAQAQPFALPPEAPKPPQPPRKKKGSMFEDVANGWKAFWDPANADQRGMVTYVTLAFLIFTLLTTIQSVPYYALGIELCPSYDGRTRVVTYRSVMDKIAGLASPWVPVFCFWAYFTNALDGLFWVAIICAAVGIPSTVLMAMFVKERHAVSSAKKYQIPMGFWKSIWATTKNPNFLRIFLLYKFVGLSNGLFATIGTYLNIYWVMGSAFSGATLGAAVGMVAWALGLLSLPVLNWGCKRFQKHVVLRVAIILMAVGSILKWWAFMPGHPERQFILPFFFSIGIGSYYAVLSTLMADVTDHDELLTGHRREGMFGATMAFLTKMTSTFVPILAGVILVLSGFDPALEYNQTPQTIFNMRLFYSIVPGVMLLCGLLLLWKYPLTRERMEAIKSELRTRRAET